MSSGAPVLHTERLVLRGHRPDDFDDCFSLWTDPQVVRFIGAPASGREEVWSRLLRYIGHWTVFGYGFFRVDERATGRFVGEVGIADFKRDISVRFDGAPEAGWVLASWAHGRGFAAEAMEAVLSRSDAAGHPRTVCIIDPANTASLRVADKLGYRASLRAAYKGKEVIALERLARRGAAAP
ncbi:GNAT family N-acetyltransferase [Sorangium sp. So ce134]